MNPVIEEIARTGKVLLESGGEVPIHSHIGAEGTAVIRRAVEAARPRVGCEAGLAFGMSTLHILDVMQETGGQKLIGMDPTQHDSTWAGGGLHNIRRAGLIEMYDFREDSSQNVLPELCRDGLRIQFGMIDGWHTFDHTLVDFFYMDRMMDVGGVIVFDDTGYPAISRMCDFILTNRSYEVMDRVRMQPPDFSRSLRTSVKEALRPLARDHLTPSAASRQRMSQARNCTLVALRKTGDDTRSFDHFIYF